MLLGCKEPKPLSGLTPIAEQGAPVETVQVHQHTNRPSRLSAVLVPAAPGVPSPPKSPTASPSQPRVTIPKSPSSEGLCRIEKQEASVSAGPSCAHDKSSFVKASAAPATKGGCTVGPQAAAAAVNTKAASLWSSKSTPAGAAAATQSTPEAAPGGRTASGALSPRSCAESSDEGSDDVASEWGWDTKTPWYFRPRKVLVVLLLLASVGLVLAGLVLQVVLKDADSWPVGRYDEVYPWLYFFAAFPPLALALRWLCWRLYTAAEYTAIREELYFLRPLKTKLASVLFWMTILLWFQTCFNWLWCQELCEEEAYKKALLVVWRLLICVTLFAAANFLKCSIARLLSYSFYRTAHFDKVFLAIERELYLIRLSQARSALLPPAAPEPAQYPGQLEQFDGMQQPKAQGWGSTVWRRTSQVFLSPLVHAVHEAAPAAAPISTNACAAEGASLQPCAVDAGQRQSMPPSSETAFALADRVVAPGSDRVVDDAAVHVQVRHLSQATLKQHQLQPGLAAASTTPAGNPIDDNSPLLQQQALPSAAASPKVSWLHSDLQKANQKHTQQQQQPQHIQADKPGRQQSYELFTAERVPSILGMPGQSRQQHHSSRTCSKAGSRPGSRVGQQLLRGRAGSKFSNSSGRRVSLPGMVAGVDGLLLQPEVLGTASTADGQAARRAGQPMTEEELSQLRLRLGVNTFGTFVDRYYGMSPKEEAAHVRQVKRFAKGLFANVLGDAARDHILPEDFVLFFDGDQDSAHAAFEYFDRNSDGSISCTELQESAAEMLCERKNIAASIKDTDSVVNSLETGLGMLIHFLFIGLYLLVWGVNIVQGFTTFSATALALTFVFGDSVKSVFESAIYLFVSHPYDVGDALWMPGNILAKVKKIDLQFTVLLRGDGQLVWHPNNTLRTQPLVNLSRSNPRFEAYTWLVDINTPDEVLTSLGEALAAYVATQRSHFSCDPSVTWRALEDPLKLRLAVGVTYSFTGEDAKRYVAARHGILAVVRRELHKMGVKCTLPLQQQTLMPLQQPTVAPVQ